MKATIISWLVVAALAASMNAAEFQVATNGNDAQPGTEAAPLRTIQRAAELAQPGDFITVHAGTYRERVNPPRGGSETRRIEYQAAPGEHVEIKGSEVIKGWVKVQEDVWKVTLPNSFFGGFNPYADLIHGDWFDPRGRQHHTGAVYLNGDWLIEAAKLEEVLAPAGTTPAWLAQGDRYLLNVAWLGTGEGSANAGRIRATGFAAKHGTQNAPCSEGGECVGFIEGGDWVRYEKVDLGQLAGKMEVGAASVTNATDSGRDARATAGQMEIRAASASEGGIIEIRLDGAEGELLGACTVPNTGGWQSWATFKTSLKPVSGVKTLCLVFKRHKSNALDAWLWYAQVDASNTTIWAQFKGVNPNAQLVEINVRQTVFYPDQPGRNYITVVGFTLCHAATPWAPPTAEQIGLIGTHWSRGWLIYHNVISYSTCSGIALGKYGDQYDNTSANTAEGYVTTIERALQNGWNKDTIGHHVVRYNTISHCEQAGIVGSLGAAFSTVRNNTIHDIHVRRLFSGAEMAGIKFHAAIDCVIDHNHVYRTCLGLWLDWMAQGAQVSGNLFHDNAGQDLFVEVDHGPFIVYDNLFLSATSLLDMSEGGAYAHNLFGGKIVSRPEPGRQTPYHPAHDTTVAGLVNIKGGDDRFYNNIFVGKGAAPAAPGQAGAPDPQWNGGYGLWGYDHREFPLQTGGNVYYNGARPYSRETNAVVLASSDPGLKLVERDGQFLLQLNLGAGLQQAQAQLVTTALLGKARVPGLPYENADGSPLKIATVYFGDQRGQAQHTPGPFGVPAAGPLSIRLW